MHTVQILLCVAGACVALAAAGAPAVAASEAPARAKIVVLTDISVREPDDKQSMVRLLVYANEFEILGLVSNVSVTGKDRIHPKITHGLLDAYAQVVDNLSKHAKGYPSAEQLRPLVQAGQRTYGMAGVGKGKTTDGSKLIERVLVEQDGPIWFLGWGGMNTLAQSMRDLRDAKTPAEMDAIAAKVHIYDIAGQGDSIAWMAHEFPKITVLRSRLMFMGFSPHSADKKGWGGDDSCISADWYRRNVQRDHGPLGAMYPGHVWMVEGDTPSFLHLLPVGLNPDLVPHYGGWGGRFGPEPKRNVLSRYGGKIGEKKYFPYRMYTEAADQWGADAPDYHAGKHAPYQRSVYASLFRWRRHIQNDFAARMDWCVRSYADANHPPIAKVAGKRERTARRKQVVPLSAAGSSDPDGDKLTYHWYFYRSASTCNRDVVIDNAGEKNASLTVPYDAVDGEEIHVILTVTDAGDPPLTRYQRVVITVRRGPA